MTTINLSSTTMTLGLNSLSWILMTQKKRLKDQTQTDFSAMTMRSHLTSLGQRMMTLDVPAVMNLTFWRLTSMPVTCVTVLQRLLSHRG